MDEADEAHYNRARQHDAELAQLRAEIEQLKKICQHMARMLWMHHCGKDDWYSDIAAVRDYEAPDDD